MSEALGKIRAALKGHDLLGAEAIDLQPGAVVLVVLRHPNHIDRAQHAGICAAALALADDLKEQGIRACAAVVPDGFGLDVIEVAPGVASTAIQTIEAEAERWRRVAIAAHAAGDLAAQAIAIARCDSLTGAVYAVRGKAFLGAPIGVVPEPDVMAGLDAKMKAATDKWTEDYMAAGEAQIAATEREPAAVDFGLTTVGAAPSAPLAGYPVDRITSAGVKVKP